MVEYYRGLCTFEDAVNAVEETGIATSQAINNLETGITNAIQEMALGIRTDIQQNSYAIVASQQMLANTFKQGFNSINNTLNFGFDYLGNKIDVLSDKICSKLDKIHDILNNPRLTASRELYRNALKDFQNRYYEEALENCIGAIEKNKTDYISWFLLGMIYFCGKSKFSNVHDINKAEDAFFNAAKYVDAVVGKTEEANIFASAIYYYLGHIRLIISNDYLIENKIEESNKKLLEAEEASRTSYQLSKENLLARYEQAKHLHFLGKDDESLKLLEELIRKEKNFAIKSVNDKNFESLWGDIEKLIEKLKLEICNPIPKKLKETIDFYKNKLKANDEIANYELPRNYRTSNIEVFQKKQNELKLRYADIENNDYFTVLNLKKQLSGDLDNFSNEISNLIHDTKTAIEQKLAEERRIQQEARRKQEEENRKIQEEEKCIKEEEQKRKRIRNAKIRIILISLLIGGIIGTVLWYLIDELFSYNSEMYQVVAGFGMVILCIPFTIAVSVLEGFSFFEDASAWGGVLVCSCIVFAIPLFSAGYFYAEHLPLVGFSIITVFSGLVGLFFLRYPEYFIE